MVKLFKKGILLFTNDLRAFDNKVLDQAIKSCESLLVLSIVDEQQFVLNSFDVRRMGHIRRRFYYQTLQDLQIELAGVHLNLNVLIGNPIQLLSKIIPEYDIEALFISRAIDPSARELLRGLERTIQLAQNAEMRGTLAHLKIFECMNYSLFDQSQFDFELKDLPDNVYDFIQYVEAIAVKPPFYNHFKSVPTNAFLGPEYEQYRLRLDFEPAKEISLFSFSDRQLNHSFIGGSTFGLQQLQFYLQEKFQERQFFGARILGFDSSDLLMTPWLANGSISLRTLWYALLEYEDSHGQSGLITRLLQSLLRYEHCQWIALKYGAGLYELKRDTDAHTRTFYAERFVAWRNGCTPYPLVNACMNQLNETGFLTNIAKRVLASCLVDQFQVSWKYGAAYFQMQLVDYDPGTTWGGWLELARVLPTYKRSSVDFDSIARLHDPDGSYIRRWRGEETVMPVDNHDMVGWPLG